MFRRWQGMKGRGEGATGKGSPVTRPKLHEIAAARSDDADARSSRKTGLDQLTVSVYSLPLIIGTSRGRHEARAHHPVTAMRGTADHAAASRGQLCKRVPPRFVDVRQVFPAKVGLPLRAT